MEEGRFLQLTHVCWELISDTSGLPGLSVRPEHLSCHGPGPAFPTPLPSDPQLGMVFLAHRVLQQGAYRSHSIDGGDWEERGEWGEAWPAVTAYNSQRQSRNFELFGSWPPVEVAFC